MDEENRRLDAEIKALKSDPKAIEKEAREQLRYAKPGEVIYLLPEQPGQHRGADPSANGISAEIARKAKQKSWKESKHERTSHWNSSGFFIAPNG